ncbi:MAG: 4-carboxymuconolactone decarboxylase [Nocardioidaceae bacterium]|jgi:4-carboxymuconolactone decarboxylase|nr:4-carboxymuconolactone decarboxylase [Nocardioidaceae bacterium]
MAASPNAERTGGATGHETTLRERHEVALDVQQSIFGASAAEDPDAWPAEAALKALWTDVCFGDSWARPGLDRRTKSMVTIAMLLARGASTTLIRHHVEGGLGLGITRDEMAELFIHATAYCGAPATAGTWSSVRDLMDEP